ncbi:uncharacterized protein RG961_012873 [Leptosomus discolor]
MGTDPRGQPGAPVPMGPTPPPVPFPVRAWSPSTGFPAARYQPGTPFPCRPCSLLPVAPVPGIPRYLLLNPSPPFPTPPRSRYPPATRSSIRLPPVPYPLPCPSRSRYLPVLAPPARIPVSPGICSLIRPPTVPVPGTCWAWGHPGDRDTVGTAVGTAGTPVSAERGYGGHFGYGDTLGMGTPWALPWGHSGYGDTLGMGTPQTLPWGHPGYGDTLGMGTSQTLPWGHPGYGDTLGMGTPREWGHPGHCHGDTLGFISGDTRWGQLFGAAGTMYGNIEASQDGPGQMWGLGPGGSKACSDPCPAEENLYEPLDPTTAAPSQKDVPDPPGTAWATPRPPSARHDHAAVKAGDVRGPVVTYQPSPAAGCCPGKKLALVGTVALGVSVLMNVVFLAVGSRHIAALTEALEAEKAKEVSNVASRSFLMYNEHHGKCVVAKGQELTVTTCQAEAAAQRFQWLPGGRLRGWGSRRCVTALHGQNLSAVRLEPCRAGGTLQRWECRGGGLLALAGYNLYFNYGNNVKNTVMLYIGDREWSRWVVHGTREDVCSRACCPPCSKGWTYFGNSCYFYSKTASSWESAKSFCSLLGAQLLEVDGPEEKDHVRTMLQSSSWLGIRDEEVEGTWKRANGTILTRESSSWHRYEPNGGPQENCAVVRKDGEWYDYPCTSQLPWVCEGHPWACEGHP